MAQFELYRMNEHVHPRNPRALWLDPEPTPVLGEAELDAIGRNVPDLPRALDGGGGGGR